MLNFKYTATDNEKQGETGMLFDGHTHTWYSHDSDSDPRAMCEAALAAGLGGISVTDHCDIEWEIDVDEPIRKSVAHAAALAKEYEGRLRVFRGMEIGEALWAPEHAHNVETMTEYDVIIGSVHAVRYAQFPVPFSWINFKQFSERQLRDYLSAYFRDTLDLVKLGGFDVLGHLTCVLRYVVEKYACEVDLEPVRPLIDEILTELIARSIALEVNTSSPNFLPDKAIVRRYYDLGGRLITLGSDAHTPDRVGKGIADAAAMLRTIGLTQAYYYDHRRAVAYDL